MSASLYYRVVHPKDTSIGWLDYIIAEKFFGGQKYGSQTVDARIIPFLEGVKAGSSDKNVIVNCDKLISAINKEGEVELYFAS
jgi:hypothetical protein